MSRTSPADLSRPPAGVSAVPDRTVPYGIPPYPPYGIPPHGTPPCQAAP